MQQMAAFGTAMQCELNQFINVQTILSKHDIVKAERGPQRVDYNSSANSKKFQGMEISGMSNDRWAQQAQI